MSTFGALLALLAVAGAAQDTTAVEQMDAHVDGDRMHARTAKKPASVAQSISVSPEGELHDEKPLARRKDSGKSSGVSAVLPNAMITEADEQMSDELDKCLEVNGWRNPEELLLMNATNKRDTVIVEVSKLDIFSVGELQAKSDGELADLCQEEAEGFAVNKLDQCLQVNGWRSPEQLSLMSANNKRTTFIVDLSKMGNFSVPDLQAKSNGELADLCPKVVCNAMCTLEFVDNCFPLQVKKKKKTAAEAYDICRYQKDYPRKAQKEGGQHGWNKRKFKGCKRCTDSPNMVALNPNPTASPTTASSTGAGTIRSLCCSYNTNYGMVPHHGWGNTPNSEKAWYSANNCDSVMGMDTLSNCRYDLTPGATCQTGYQPITSAWEECRDAAMELGFTGDAVAHVDYKWDYATRSHPAGCFQAWDHDRFHFNLGAGGAFHNGDNILCARNYDLTPGATCQTGYQPITSTWEDCRDAAMELGWTGDAVAHVAFKWDYATKSHPEGCFQAWDHDRFHFNLGAGGAFQNGDNILCIKAAS